MTFLKRSILFVLLIGMFPYQVNADNQRLWQPLSRYFAVVKGGVKISTAIGAALLAHIGTELPIVLAHEYGHQMGNSLTGGQGGRVEVECNLLKHPLAVLMPFFAEWCAPEKYGNGLVVSAAGPMAGIGTNYAMMVGMNSLYAWQNGSSQKEIIKSGLASPWYAYKKISNEMTQMIVEKETYKMPSFAEIFLITFNLLKTSKMFGEFLYGLTPISIENGDGQRLWQELGFKKSCAVSEWIGLGLATVPAFGAIAYGLAKGIYLRLRNKEISVESRSLKF